VTAHYTPERFDPDDESFRTQTRTHHIERYKFAATFHGKGYLDICCGYGYGTNLVKESHPTAHVKGIDNNVAVIQRAKKKYPDCLFEVADVNQPFVDNRFDIAVFFEAIEHLTYQEGLKVVQYIYDEVLSPGGVLLISTPRDALDKYNSFHKSVWPFATLKNVLGSLFKETEILGQSWDTGKIDHNDVVNNSFYICICTK
jgi:trans-aconitate methyltransferase